MFKSSKQCSFGLTYRSNIDLDFDGNAGYYRHVGIYILDNMTYGGGGSANLSRMLIPHSDINSDLRLPDAVAVGIMNHRIKDLILEAESYGRSGTLTVSSVCVMGSIAAYTTLKGNTKRPATLSLSH